IKNLAALEAWLEAIVAAFDKGLYANGCPIGTLASELATTNEEHRKNLASTFARWEELLAKAFRNMRGRGLLDLTADPESLAMFVISTVEGALLLAKTEKSKGPLQAAKDHILNYLRAMKN